MSFRDWQNKPTVIVPYGLDSSTGTMREAMLIFFHNGVSPWIEGLGYRWSQEKDYVANKFVHLCYMIYTTAKMSATYDLDLPEPKHRNYDEDRETFDLFVDTNDLLEFLSYWSFRSEIVGTRFDHLIKEFCYVWVDVTRGKPGAFTQKIFDAEDEEEAEDDMVAGPDMSSRKKWDLY